MDLIRGKMSSSSCEVSALVREKEETARFKARFRSIFGAKLVFKPCGLLFLGPNAVVWWPNGLVPCLAESAAKRGGALLSLVVHTVSLHVGVTFANLGNHALQRLAGTALGEVRSAVGHHVVDLLRPKN